MTKVGKIPENSGLFLLEGFPKVSVLSDLMEDCVTRHREDVAVRVLASLEAPHQLSNIIRGHLVDLNNVPVYQQLWEEGIIEGM